MTTALLIALGVAIGLLLGALGGGGAVLAVPALVFLVGQDAGAATTSSLVIVAAAAVTGAASHVRSGGIAWRTGLAFGLASVPGAWAGSQLNQAVPENVLLVSFGALMLVAASAMLRGLRSDDGDPHRDGPRRAQPRDRRAWLAVLAAGLGVGALTGFLGVGGGFVVVPVLVLALRLPMGRAVGTSLVVVAITSAGALASRAPVADFQWDVIGPFAGAAVTATLLGRRVADRLPARQLQGAFAALLVLVASYTLVRGLTG